MTDEPLYEATCRLLRECPRHITLSQIAKDTGLKASWLSAFSRNQIPDPGVKKVQRLFDYLSVKRPVPAGRYELEVIKDFLPKGHRATVYFVYADTTPIYIGCTQSPYSRITQHNRKRDFAEHNATHIECVYFDGDEGEREARAFEKDQIRRHKPKLNGKLYHVGT